ncbi:GNAT family N-acetyltransferase [Shewanella bicestrii]|uniref:GNAT family N-acetyltransferase n=1 Tax=Shewanella sp. Sh95 TaxID=1689868 RepID=UPI0006DA64A6|nr:GNAT family N-acetyltransferase [Shewanella sp. Sh95]KPN77490.1 butyryltransferase [Shewanella sp. Sh95]
MLKSKTISMRLIEESDAEFVLRLRLDPRYNNFLSKVDADLNGQKKWIRNYKIDEHNKKQFYFIIVRNDGVPCGTVRIYDIRNDSFCWGSWILNEDKTRYAAIESALLVYDFGFNEMKYNKSHFDVMKGNEKVINFHKKFGAIQTGEDEQNYYFEISKESVEHFKEKFKDYYA